MTDRAVWRTSSYSSSGGGNCVEVGPFPDGVAIRDTKDRTGPSFLTSRDEWAGFVQSIKDGTLRAQPPTA